MSFTIEIPIAAIDAFIGRLPGPGTADVTMEVLGGDLGDQIEVERLPWHSMVHDRVSRVIEISVGERNRSSWIALRHEITDAERVWVEEADGAVVAMSIDHADGLQTIIRFHRRAAIGVENSPSAYPVLLADRD